MESSPSRPLYHRKLYRNRLFAVTLSVSILLASSWLTAQILTPQFGRKQERDNGPRALALIQLTPKGKGRLIPIAIMLDGKFYDAGAYKAAPVPMALDFGIVYEAFRSGVSQGVFTITQPGQLNHAWIAEGTWLPAGSKALEKHKKFVAPVIEDDDKSGPPVLHRRAEKTDSDSGANSASSGNSKDHASTNTNTDTSANKDQQKTASAPTSPATAAPAGAPNPADSKPPATPDSAKAPAETAKADEPVPDEDPNRPRLRRGKPDATVHSEPYTTFDALPGATPKAAAKVTAKPDATAPKDSAATPQIITFPAISDAGGPDPRPYLYDLKPAEEAIYRTKMLDLAATEARASAAPATKAAATPKTAAGKPASKSTAKVPAPEFDDVKLRIFDLSNSNEPILVLSAKTKPSAPNATGKIEPPKEITLIARTNLEGDLRKLFFSQTDAQHLDETPRMELVDAVDADGDGRGELLFRRTYDTGSAFAIYRVTADGLWPLFEGTP
jgi:hypothetical protein